MAHRRRVEVDDALQITESGAVLDGNRQAQIVG
jgi:hypothetical protein